MDRFWNKVVWLLELDRMYSQRIWTNSKLTTQQVLDARKRHSLGESCTDIAKSMDVNRATISKIINNVNWKHTV